MVVAQHARSAKQCFNPEILSTLTRQLIGRITRAISRLTDSKSMGHALLAETGSRVFLSVVPSTRRQRGLINSSGHSAAQLPEPPKGAEVPALSFKLQAHAKVSISTSHPVPWPSPKRPGISMQPEHIPKQEGNRQSSNTAPQDEPKV
jgi:hypothetical protein